MKELNLVTKVDIESRTPKISNSNEKKTIIENFRLHDELSDI